MLQPLLFPGFGLPVWSSARCTNLFSVWCLLMCISCVPNPLFSVSLDHLGTLLLAHWSSGWFSVFNSQQTGHWCGFQMRNLNVLHIFSPNDWNFQVGPRDFLLGGTFLKPTKCFILLWESDSKMAVRSVCGLLSPCWRWQGEMEEVQHVLCLLHVTTLNEGKGDVGKISKCQGSRVPQ